MLGAMDTSPTLLIRPKPRKFEDLAREEMKRQQMLLSNRTQNDTENSTVVEIIKNRTIIHGIDKPFYDARAQVAPPTSDLPSSAAIFSAAAETSFEKTVVPTDVDLVQVVAAQKAGRSYSCGDPSPNNRPLHNMVGSNVKSRSIRSVADYRLKGEKIRDSEFVSVDDGNSCDDSLLNFRSMPNAPFDLHNASVQRSTSLSLSSDDEVQQHRHVRERMTQRSKSDSCTVEVMQKFRFQNHMLSNAVMYYPKECMKPEGRFSEKKKPLLNVDRGANDDHDSPCNENEKYVSSDTDNDDASTMTHSSGGNDAASEAEDACSVDDEEDNDDNDEGEHYGEEVQSDEGHIKLANNVEGSQLQQALKRLAFFSRSAQKTLSKNIITNSWFSSDSNGINTPASSHPPPRFGSFTGDSDSLRYSSMDSFTSAVNTSSNNNSNQNSFVASGFFGFMGNASVATYSSSAVAANSETSPWQFASLISASHDGSHQVLSREVEKQQHSPVPPNLPRSKNRTSTQGDQPESSSTQPKYILVGNSRKKGLYGSFESKNRPQADLEEAILVKKHLTEDSEKSALLDNSGGKRKSNKVKSTSHDFNLHKDNTAEADEEIVIAGTENAAMGQEVYNFHTYFWRGVIAMSVTCLFIFLLTFLFEKGLF